MHGRAGIRQPAARWPLVVFITLINGIAEELFFRGALYSALGTFYPVAVSTAVYIVTTLASGNPMLGFAAVLLGTVCALQRRLTEAILGADAHHFCWGWRWCWRCRRSSVSSISCSSGCSISSRYIRAAK